MKYLKKSIYLIVSIFVCINIISCDKDEDTWEARIDLAGWGYFDGKINGDSVYLENQHAPRSYTSKVCYKTCGRIEACRIDIEVPEKDVLFSCRILNPCLGSFEIVNQHPENPYIDDFNSFDGGDSYGIPFEPKDDNPAKVNITNIEYKQVEGNGGMYKSIHIIEGDIDAVLYRGEESISIKGHFATK